MRHFARALTTKQTHCIPMYRWFCPYILAQYSHYWTVVIPTSMTWGSEIYGQVPMHLSPPKPRAVRWHFPLRGSVTYSPHTYIPTVCICAYYMYRLLFFLKIIHAYKNTYIYIHIYIYTYIICIHMDVQCIYIYILETTCVCKYIYMHLTLHFKGFLVLEWRVCGTVFAIGTG